MSMIRALAADLALTAALEDELHRQSAFIELIASENYVSPAVLAAQGSVLTNKYADGYPGARTYRGCEHVDTVETLACERACALFDAAYANVQPYSGTQANAAVYAALLAPGDTMLGMAAAHGGHITHGHPSSFAGRFYHAVHYGLDPATGLVDYDEVAELARTHRPRLIIAGFSAYSRALDWARFRDIADSTGAMLLIDMAHAAGLIAAGLWRNPVPFADVCTSTTHKTLRGPRGGLIVARSNAAVIARLAAGVYPQVQGGPLMHVIAAKAAAFGEALQPEFAAYQQRTLENARELAAALAGHGFDVITGGTDNHMLLLRLAAAGPDANMTADILEEAHIAVSTWRLPGDDVNGAPRGLRLGTPAVTTRGFGGTEMRLLADWIARLYALAGNPDARHQAVAEIRSLAHGLCERLPVYGPGSVWGS